jgi:hypothetical protein
MKMKDDKKVYEHESYGMISVSRMSGTRGFPLFGSSLENNPSMIQVVIAHGQRYHSLGYDHYHGAKEIIRLWMTPAQYAEMISNPNCGTGVPCTIRHIEGVEMDWPPEVPNEGKLVRDRFKLEVSELRQKAANGGQHLKAILSTAKISQKLKDEIQGTYEAATRFLWDAAPFLLESFQEAVEKSVVEAKQEIDAFLAHALQTTGAQALTERLQKTNLLGSGCSICHDPECKIPNEKH